jgi:ribosomal protein S18 acetylase RimI-like enzyme
VIGICLGDESKADEGGGFVRTLGVSRPARGRGVARALLRTAFAEYQGRGRAFVQLAVDAGNTTGATRLYVGVGMRAVTTIDTYEKALRLADAR